MNLYELKLPIRGFTTVRIYAEEEWDAEQAFYENEQRAGKQFKDNMNVGFDGDDEIEVTLIEEDCKLDQLELFYDLAIQHHPGYPANPYRGSLYHGMDYNNVTKVTTQIPTT